MPAKIAPVLLPNCRHETLSRTERDADVDCGTSPGLRINRKRSLHQFYSLLHVFPR